MDGRGRPSVSSKHRPAGSSARCGATRSQPAIHPPAKSVDPRASISCRLRTACRLASLDALVDSTTTSTRSSYATSANRSSERSIPRACVTASRASRILLPPIEPERSTANATWIDCRPAVRGASGAVSARRKCRVAGAPAGTTETSVRSETCVGWFVPHSLNGHCDRAGHARERTDRDRYCRSGQLMLR
jgi:hypothetical protein